MNYSFEGKQILITGGTGSIGTGLIRSLLRDNPAVIRVFSRDESKQYYLEQDLGPIAQMRYLLGDVRDRERLVRAMEGIDVVFHLAGLKHVPACEYNPFEAVKTNVLGTQNVIEAAFQNGVERVVATSSDKSISPTNAMGATKLLVERLMAAANWYRGYHRTVLCSVRFGNVIGSRGSVIPTFYRQILRDREITLTDRDMTRFMMSNGQAVNLTKQALRIARGGEVFVLKMPLVRLGDLAEVVVEEICSRLGINAGEVKTRTVGLRPGEKRYEELMTLEESRGAMELPDMYVIPPVFGGPDYQYPGSHPAREGEYSSASGVPMTRPELREFLLGERVFDLTAEGVIG